ncbi:MAG: glycosyltransferase family 8 protein [Bacteroidales bacterium]|nr:glycosyltransferase family 8 protein [Bacteroidales bacterium]
MIHLVCCSDSNYLQHTAVMLVSLFENNKEREFTVHLIGPELDKNEFARFTNTIENFNQTLCYYKFDQNLLKDFPNTRQYISNTTWCRIFIQDILPDNVEKVLYLDGDIVVTGDISPLWQTNLNNKLLAAVSDEINGYDEYYSRYGFPKDYVYFNAGVLLINLYEWRKYDVRTKALEYLSKEHPALENADQDLLNIICAGKTVELPLRYNLQDALCRKKILHIRKDVEEILDSEIREGKVFHFSCPKKPWTFRCIHPLKSLYYQYLEKTEWKNKIEGINDREVIYMIFYWVAYAFGLTNRYRKSVKTLGT